MVVNFLECNYLFKDSRDIVREFPIKLKPKKSKIYGDGNAAKKIVKVLERIKHINLQK